MIHSEGKKAVAMTANQPGTPTNREIRYGGIAIPFMVPAEDELSASEGRRLLRI
jgi:hypothetical protein